MVARAKRPVPRWTREQLSTVEGQLRALRPCLESIQHAVDTASSKRAAMLLRAWELACAAVDRANAKAADEKALEVSAAMSDGEGVDADIIPIAAEDCA